MGEFFFGIDLGGTNVEIGLLDSKGNIHIRETFATEVELGPESLIDRLANCGDRLISDAKIARHDVKGIGIGSPGPLSLAEGKIIKSVNMPGYDDFSLRGLLSQKMGIAAFFDNDANAACWGEFWQGAGKDIDNMVMFTLGTGIGGGIVNDGELVHGCDDNGAELGHMIIQPDGRLCNCRQNGCLEAYASASATAQRACEALEKGRQSTMADIKNSTGGPTCKDVFDHANAGDELACQIVDGTAKALALACVNILHVTEPQMVVLGGGMIKSGEILLKRLRFYFHEIVWKIKEEPLEITLAKLGSDAGVIGAAGLAVHAYQQQGLYPIGQ